MLDVDSLRMFGPDHEPLNLTMARTVDSKGVIGDFIPIYPQDLWIQVDVIGESFMVLFNSESMDRIAVPFDGQSSSLPEAPGVKGGEPSQHNLGDAGWVELQAGLLE